MMYFLLIRKISPYTAPDILLGAFDSEHAVQKARNSYLDRYRPMDQHQPDTNPNGDPWHIQGYKPAGLTEDDLVVQTFDMETDPALNEISVVSCYYDAMGQILQEIDSIHPNRLMAEQRMKEIETIAENAIATDPMPPNQFDTQTIRINEIQSDAPEHQAVR